MSPLHSVNLAGLNQSFFDDIPIVIIGLVGKMEPWIPWFLFFINYTKQQKQKEYIYIHKVSC